MTSDDYLQFLFLQNTDNPDVLADPEFAAFRSDFSRIQQAVDVYPQVDMDKPIQAQQLSNLTDQQIQNPENEQFSEYVDIDAHETDYDNPKLAITATDALEIDLAEQLATLSSEPDNLHAIGLIGKNLSPETYQDISRSTAQIIAKNRNHVPDLQQFATDGKNLDTAQAKEFILKKITDRDNVRINENIKSIYTNTDTQTKQQIQDIQQTLYLAHTNPESLHLCSENTTPDTVNDCFKYKHKAELEQYERNTYFMDRN